MSYYSQSIKWLYTAANNMKKYVLLQMPDNSYSVNTFEQWEANPIGKIVDTSDNRSALEDEADQRNYEREQQLEFDLYDYTY